ncbi:MAG: hypothetical protein P4L92_14375 [Rudaea sp.]|nr:hypothetical protein [Rudaea sp.]
MSARVTRFPVRTRALSLEEQRIELRAQKLYVQKLVRTELEEIDQNQKQYVRTARTREDAGKQFLAYIKSQLRDDLMTAGPQSWRDFALQLWSALHPDPHAKPTRPIADIQRYTRALLARIDMGTFVPPPEIAQLRRDRARMERRKISAARRIEARRMAEVAAALAHGEYPGHG